MTGSGQGGGPGGPRPDAGEQELRRALVEACRRLHAAGLLAGTAGNVSARLGGGLALVTPRGVRKDELRPGDLVLLALDDASPDGLAHGLVHDLARATTEWPLHRLCYAADLGESRVGAVVHTHAPALTALGLRGLTLAGHLPEADDAVGGSRLVPYAPTGSEALGRAVAEAVASGAGVVLLERHGAVAVGHDLAEAVDRMELAELSARAILLA